MGGQRIIIDENHVMRQHRTFAVMVIAGLLIVVLVWLVQIRFMVRRVDFTKLRQDVEQAQQSFQGAFDEPAQAPPATADGTASASTNSDVRAAVGTRALDALTADTNEPSITE